MQSQDFVPFPHRAMNDPSSGPADRRSLLDALSALTAQAEAAGLDLTAARLRAVGKLACAEMVQAGLKRLV
ncbi:hypothetical protein ACFQS7_02715 [Dankookia sp. GCM10030260]|uniref:hypothetical protein n=1 Tax=Dankookia sp. GCM10030260 TaxID=3273390 RepID=UPI00360B4A81